MRKWKPIGRFAQHTKFASKLRFAMLMKELSCGDIAVRLDVSISAVWRWIAGDKLPSARNLEQLKAILEIDGNLIWEE